MKNILLVALIGIALLATGCKTNNDQKPVYFVPPTAIAV